MIPQCLTSMLAQAAGCRKQYQDPSSSWAGKQTYHNIIVATTITIAITVFVINIIVIIITIIDAKMVSVLQMHLGT